MRRGGNIVGSFCCDLYRNSVGICEMQRQDNENRGVAQMLKGPKALFTQGLFAFFIDTNKKHMP